MERENHSYQIPGFHDEQGGHEDDDDNDYEDDSDGHVDDDDADPNFYHQEAEAEAVMRACVLANQVHFHPTTLITIPPSSPSSS